MSVKKSEEISPRMAKLLGLTDEQMFALNAIVGKTPADMKRRLELLLPLIIRKGFGFLDDCTSFDLAEAPFLKTVKEKELEIFGKATPGCRIMEYETGSKMMYDATVASLEEFVPSVLDLFFESDKAREIMARAAETDEKSKVQGSLASVSVIIRELPFLLKTFVKIRLLDGELSKLVLGQYDLREFTDISKEELRFADDNIRAACEETGMDYARLKAYVEIHEEMHNFAAWYLGLLAGQRNTMGCIINKVMGREIQCVTKEDQEEMLVFGAAVEGHAEFFADKIAADLLPGFEFKRMKPGFFRKLKWRIIGLEKLRNNYVVGPVFIEYLYNKGGVDLANSVFEKPPKTMAEVLDPELYLKRIAAEPAFSSDMDKSGSVFPKGSSLGFAAIGI